MAAEDQLVKFNNGLVVCNLHVMNGTLGGTPTDVIVIPAAARPLSNKPLVGLARDTANTQTPTLLRAYVRANGTVALTTGTAGTYYELAFHGAWATGA